MEKEDFYALDLFAGCGGLSEGFKKAGFKIVGQVEMDKWACETLRTRHLYYELKKIGERRLYDRYLRGEIGRDEILKQYPVIEESIDRGVIQLTLGRSRTTRILERIRLSQDLHNASRIHVVLGGPPCQPYSIVGRARDSKKMENDERNYLYRHYLNILKRIQPDIFVYENVPGLFSAEANGIRIFTRMLDDFASLEPSYEITPPLAAVQKEPSGYILDSADFQVPQTRKRLIVIGYKRSLEKKNPELRKIFSRLQIQASRDQRHLTVRDAIGDLPPLRPGHGNDDWFGSYTRYQHLRDYQKMMRRESPGVVNHKARPHMESDLERYRFFIEHHKNGNGAATLYDLKMESPDLIPNHKNLKDFLDRFKVQWWDKPCFTVAAHIRKDGHYYIHPDLKQCRSFTVREAARCQSFPDNFKFEGPRTEQFKQVGNAVPPLLAKAIGGVILKELQRIYSS